MNLDWQATLGWMPSSEQRQQFEAFYEALMLANQSMNLTRITHRDEFLEKHLWDSLSGIQPWLRNLDPDDWRFSLRESHLIQSVVDIGTGGGLPGVPVAIACPDWSVTLLDATQKKILSLQQIVEAIPCNTAHPICDRAELLALNPNHSEAYDLALVRAVAAPGVCAEYALPLLKQNGIAVLYRGHWLPEDEQSLDLALKALGGTLVNIEAFQTPLTQSDRHCVYLQKTHPTPVKFPRRAGLATRKPIGE